jgi:Peptidase C13 family
MMAMNEDVSTAPADPPRSYWAAMLRLWGLRNVYPPRSSGSVPLIIFCAVWVLIWIGIDRWNAEPEPQLIADNLPLFAWYALAILALAALCRACSRPTPEFRLALLLAVGLVPVPLFLANFAAPYLETGWLLAVSVAAVAYSILYLARGLRHFTGRSQPIATGAGLIFVAAFVWLSNALTVIPNVWAAPETPAVALGSSGGVDAEALMFEQAARIDEAIAAIGTNTSSKPKSFFLGFAGVGDQKVFAQEIGLASRVLAERYDIGARSLSLINDERELERAPLASVTGLRYALQGVAARMNLDRDVLFLSISSHGAKDPAIAVSNSQLPLNDLTDEELAAALDDAGIKWRVIIISACYAGGFIDSLKNRQTIVITAAARDRTSFGCSNDRDLTYFGEAFYRDALPGARSLRDAFDQAKAAISAREKREHVDPSMPQAYFGADMEAKLVSIGVPL